MFRLVGAYGLSCTQSILWDPSVLWLDTQIQRLPGGLSAQPPLVLLSKPQVPLPPPYAYRMGYRENVKMLA